MEQLGGHKVANSPGHVCSSLKALHGLEYSPRQWFEKINEFHGILGSKAVHMTLAFR